jgi:hypothetical protein
MEAHMSGIYGVDVSELTSQSQWSSLKSERAVQFGVVPVITAME